MACIRGQERDSWLRVCGGSGGKEGRREHVAACLRRQGRRAWLSGRGGKKGTRGRGSKVVARGCAAAEEK